MGLDMPVAAKNSPTAEQDLLSAIDNIEARCRAWLDQFVAQAQMPGIPLKSTEIMFTRGAPDIYAVRRLLKEGKRVWGGNVRASA